MNQTFLILITNFIYCIDEIPLNNLNPIKKSSSNSRIQTTRDIESNRSIEEYPVRKRLSKIFCRPFCEYFYFILMDIFFIIGLFCFITGIVTKYYYLSIMGLLSFFLTGMAYGLYKYMQTWCTAGYSE